MSNQVPATAPSKSKRGLHFLLLTLVLSIVAFFGAAYSQRLADYVLAAQFRPTAQIAAIDNTLKLTDFGSRTFYASKPRIESGATFNADCQSTERTTAMLGCYYRREIYLYDVTNPELKGAKEVTAAHEMLHAAYERLPFFEKARIDTLLHNEYERHKNEKDFADLVAYYQKTEPNAVVNELHSIIGTTLVSVSPELEAYYKQYFADRQGVVAMNTRYNAVFAGVKAESDRLVAQIDQLGPALEADITKYNQEQTQLEADIAAFNSRAASGDFTSQSSFTITRNALLARADQLNAARESINARVSDYNNLVTQLKALSVRSEALNKSINGITTPETSV